MNTYRRSLVAAAGGATIAPLLKTWASSTAPKRTPQASSLMLSSFTSGYLMPGATWRGLTDRVMGGVSNAELESTSVAGKNCIRLTGNVTRENNGGFVKMALYFGSNYKELDGSTYKGISLLVYGNNEDYNLHVRTSDCRGHSESYRLTFFAKSEWQRMRIPWDAFTANKVDAPLNSSTLQRIGILGWMREFEADIALAEISLYS